MIRIPATTSSPCALVRKSPYGEVLARRRVARERDAGAGVVALVAEHHRLDVDRGAEVVGDALHAAVVTRAAAVPRLEHRLDRVPELRGRVVRERRRPRPSATISLNVVDQTLEVVGREVGVDGRRPAPPSARASASSKSSPGTSRTILPNIWTKRRYESYANRSLPVCLARPCTESSLSPRLRTVSIIPGIENGAPERTETSSGSTSSPRRLPMSASSAVRAVGDLVHQAVGQRVAGGHVGVARLGRDREARAGPADRASSSRRGSPPCRRAGTSAPWQPSWKAYTYFMGFRSFRD